MQAVLARTHIGRDLQSFLLPVLEAVSNAMHSIEERYNKNSARDGRIDIIFRNPNDPTKVFISVKDNGIGMNDENYKSFKTPFSGYKLKMKGRGFGRFISFKVFSKINYFSCYEFMKLLSFRCFHFDIRLAEEFVLLTEKPNFDHIGLCVTYERPLLQWNDLIRELNKPDIIDRIASHFLPHFLYKWLPEITLKFDDSPAESITNHFRSVFVESNKGNIEIEIDGEMEILRYSLAKIAKTRSYKSHCLLFAAADRIVGVPKDLTNVLGQPHFTNEKNENYIVIGVVRGEAFERRLNDARTGIDLPSKAVELIVSAVSEIIQTNENSQIEKIKTAQSVDLGSALQENPILRLGLRGKSIAEYVSTKPNNWKAQQFVADLAIERFRASKELTRAITTAADNRDNYIENIKDIVSKIDANNKEALAEYVIHRKNVIELVETARKYTEEMTHAPEDVIHDLVFKRFTDSATTDYFEHNLWLIDDALAFMPYVTSDRTAKGTRRRKGDKVPDLAFFDDSLILGDNDGTTVTIVEFKRPSRDNYATGPAKTDPVKQVLDTLKLAVRAGGVSRTDGTHMSFTGVVRRFGFIIADLTPTLIKVLEDHDFNNDQNPKIWIRHRDREKITIQAIGYDTLVENAKKRNQAFFSVLLGE